MIHCGWCNETFEKYSQLPFIATEGFANCCPNCGTCDYERGAKFTEVEEDSPMNHLKKGDKLRRISDGKLFTYLSSDDSDDENYVHVEEMLVPVYLPDFEKEESE